MVIAVYKVITGKYFATIFMVWFISLSVSKLSMFCVILQFNCKFTQNWFRCMFFTLFYSIKLYKSPHPHAVTLICAIFA